ncbi:sigma-70 family RNA polymerase sigma factor [Denitrobaculum tricleocarpae]|uniref:Sigma-70 family RNA polymerase sigma factor n=1 Tax=Denitrobaculum tricleocarpae TaxID=2591009 RepID=A0A545TU00_9PROT|nr:sigma-70 family RNA polymerase sigma factor [Denitrobaculum tricleocarpae]TQV80695.1 sigma-70 family RNA polymerase sigma factor [Denitrobaculum tricleocarpae]
MQARHKKELDEASWRRFQTRLRTYIGKRVQRGDVDDLVGQVLLKLVRSRETLEAARNPSAWMIRVAANSISDYYRQRSLEQARRSSADYGGVLTSKSAQKGAVEGDRDLTAEFAACMTPLIRSLPKRYAETLLLTDIDGMTQAKAACRLGLSLSAIKSRVRRGHRKLKDALLRCCALELDRYGNIISYQQRGPCCARE